MIPLISKPCRVWVGVTFLLPLLAAGKITVCSASPPIEADGQRADLFDRDVGFFTHIQPVLHKAGCNTIECHGSFQGKAGFRLSLNARKPEDDLVAVLERIDRSDVESSPLLRKPLGLDDHGGGQILDPDSREAELLKEWVREGAPEGARWPQVELRLVADERQLPAGQQTSVRMFLSAGGEQTDVTAVCRFHVQDREVARIERIDGQDVFVAIEPGRATQVVGEYGNFVASLEMYVVSESGPGHVPIAEERGPEPDSIDEFIARRHRRLGIEPLPICSDEVFVRRVCLDLVGRLPTVEEFYAFVENTDPDKRNKFIDEKLESDEFAMKWGSWLGELFGARPENQVSKNIPGSVLIPAGRIGVSPERLAALWNYWFMKRIEANDPVDEIVERLLTATSRDDRSYEEYVRFLDGVYRSDSGMHDFGVKGTMEFFLAVYANGRVRDDLPTVIGGSFLGVSLQCAKCHDHPSRDWLQADHDLIGSAFSGVRFDVAPRMNSAEKHSLMWVATASCAVAAMIWFVVPAMLLRHGFERLGRVAVTIGCLGAVSVMYVAHSFGYAILRVPESSYDSLGQSLVMHGGDSVDWLLVIRWEWWGGLFAAVSAVLAGYSVVRAESVRTKSFILWNALSMVFAVIGWLLADAAFVKAQGPNCSSLVVKLRRDILESEAYVDRDVWEVFHSSLAVIEERDLQSGFQISKAFQEPSSLVAWLNEGEGDYLRRNVSNRVWEELFSDGLSGRLEVANPRKPGFDPAMQHWLANQMAVENGSIRGHVRMLVRSELYQRNALPGIQSGTTAEYRGFAVRALRGTVLINCLEQATSHEYEYPNLGEGWDSPFAAAMYTHGFGEKGCRLLGLLYPSSEVHREPNMDSVFVLMIDPAVGAAIDSKAAMVAGNIVRKRAIKDLFVECLGRSPSVEEVEVVEDRLTQGDYGVDAWSDVIWSLVNSDEFLVNR